MTPDTRTRRAVVLAAGRGIRMQEPDDGVVLTPGQAAMADAGLKMLVPIHGRPFLAYVLHELAEARLEEVCLVVGPGDDDPVRAAVEAMPLERLRASFAVQSQPRGSAHAVLAAESCVDDEPFLVINADNVYTAGALRAVGALEGSGLAGYDADALVARSNIKPERVAAFALIEEEDGAMAGIVEKPDAATALAMQGAPVSMTLWRFQPSIFQACRDTEPSPRGELELVDTVELAIRRGARFQVVPVADGVLDISRRADIPAVERWLQGVEPRP
ncbi:MAG: sugar phosphate nucleotidyltransferase [Longimicrobiales bacterium]